MRRIFFLIVLFIIAILCSDDIVRISAGERACFNGADLVWLLQGHSVFYASLQSDLLWATEDDELSTEITMTPGEIASVYTDHNWIIYSPVGSPRLAFYCKGPDRLYNGTDDTFYSITWPIDGRFPSRILDVVAEMPLILMVGYAADTDELTLYTYRVDIDSTSGALIGALPAQVGNISSSEGYSIFRNRIVWEYRDTIWFKTSPEVTDKIFVCEGEDPFLDGNQIAFVSNDSIFICDFGTDSTVATTDDLVFFLNIGHSPMLRNSHLGWIFDGDVYHRDPGLDNILGNSDDVINQITDDDLEQSHVFLQDSGEMMIWDTRDEDGQSSIWGKFQAGCSVIETDTNPSVTVSVDNLTIYPNPFNATCQIDVPAEASIKIFDVRGNLVAEFIGTNYWTPSAEVSSGVYLVIAEIGKKTTYKKAVLIR